MARKQLIFIISLAATLFILSACDPELTQRSQGAWKIQNSTGGTIVLVRILSATEQARYVIPNGETDSYYAMDFQWRNGSPYFEACYDHSGMADCVRILAQDGTLLKQWTVAEKDQSGKQFFNESSWKLRLIETGRDHYDRFWTFELLPEDIE